MEEPIRVGLVLLLLEEVVRGAAVAVQVMVIQVLVVIRYTAAAEVLRMGGMAVAQHTAAAALPAISMVLFQEYVELLLLGLEAHAVVPPK